MTETRDTRFERIRGDEDPISFRSKIGKNVRIGFGVVIDEDCEIGDNVFIGHNTVIRNKVKIADNSIIGHLVVIESETTIGAKTTIQSQCHITKYAKIGDQIFFGPGATVINTRIISHGRNFEAILEGPVIKFGSRIGAGAIIMPGTLIGKNVMIGAGSVVTSSIPDNEIWLVVPAHYARKVPRRELLDA